MEAKELLHGASAGFEEKNDVLVSVSPGRPEDGIRVKLSSPVLRQYGKHMEALITDTVQSAGYQDIVLEVKDKGAWDYTLKARVLAALERGMKID